MYKGVILDSKLTANGLRVVEYATMGVCSKLIHIETDSNGIVSNVQFVGGCSGNTQGISKLVAGMPADEVIRRLKGICCGNKCTSCPDQLATALEMSKGM